MPEFSNKPEGAAPADRADAQKDEELREDAERDLLDKHRTCLCFFCINNHTTSRIYVILCNYV